MDIHIKSENLKKTFTAAPSKSYEQRYLALALVLGEKTILRNFGNSDDVLVARRIVESLNFKISIENNELIIEKLSEIVETETPILNCGESGLSARLFVPIAGVFAKNFQVNASASLLKRNIYQDYSYLFDFGFNFKAENQNFPFYFYDTKFNFGKYIINGKNSSQLISGLLMALCLLDQDSELQVKNPVSINYILMTVEVLQKAGFQIAVEFQNSLFLKIFKRKPELNLTNKNNSFEIEGDWSGISNVLVAGALVQDISVKGLNQFSIQADKAILTVFDLAGVKYFWENFVLKIYKSKINAFEFDARNCPDLIPAIVILAVFAQGVSKIQGISRLKNKESSRAEVLQNELRKVGINLKITGDEMLIQGRQNLNTAILNPHGDHRMAMAFSILGLNISEGIKILNPDVVTKSWANYWADVFEF